MLKIFYLHQGYKDLSLLYAVELYKFLITTPDGRKLYKADPFANFAEYRPGTASVTTDLSGITWSDEEWMSARAKKDMNSEPIAIYECHIGSWMKHPKIHIFLFNHCNNYLPKVINHKSYNGYVK